MAKPTKIQQDTLLSEQYIQNRSFDPDFDVSVVEMLGYDGTNLVRLKTNSSGVVSITEGLSIPAYDYVSASYNDPAFTETYTFKTGGSGGTTVATVTVVYTDATKEKLSSVTKS